MWLKNPSTFYLPILSLFLVVAESQLIPDPTKHEVSYEEEYDAFERDAITSIPSQVKSRSKRFIYMNYDTYVAVALLVGVPVSLVLPSLGNLFSKWRRKRRSALENEHDIFYSQDHPTLQPELDRISTYFDLVDVSCMKNDSILLVMTWPCSRYLNTLANYEPYANLPQTQISTTL